MENIDLNSDFLTLLEEMEKGDDCLFITGKAGTGKSTLLKYFVSQTKLKTVNPKMLWHCLTQSLGMNESVSLQLPSSRNLTTHSLVCTSLS